MSITKELGDAFVRFKSHTERLIALVREREISSVRGLIEAVRHDRAFAEEWHAIWVEIAEADGGKLSVTSVAAVIGAVLGGVGIAFGGTAIGLPLAFVLGLGGLIAGAEVDSVRALSQTKLQILRIPKLTHRRIADTARSDGVSVNEAIVNALTAAFPDPADLDSSE